MKAIKIDVVKKEIYEVEITDDINTIYKHMECECFCQVGRRFDTGDMLLVDDNGLLLEKPLGAFRIGRYPEALSGHGIIIGTDVIGNTVSAKSNVNFYKEFVRFVDVSELGRPYFEIHPGK